MLKSLKNKGFADWCHKGLLLSNYLRNIYALVLLKTSGLISRLKIFFKDNKNNRQNYSKQWKLFIVEIICWT